MEIITKQEAEEQGLKFYFTGKPCRNGHVSRKFTKERGKRKCEQCYIEYHERNKKELAAAHARSRANNREKLSERSKNYRNENLEHCKNRDKLRYELKKEELLAGQKEYRKANPHIGKIQNARRRARLRHALVAWSQTKEIHDFYKECPDTLVVDHILPLGAKLACGFHVIENLQYLTWTENSSKKNAFTPYREINGVVVEYYND